MRCIAVLAFVSLSLVVPSCRPAEHLPVPDELATFSVHLSNGSADTSVVGMTVTTYNVDLDFDHSEAVVKPLLTRAGWVCAGTRGSNATDRSETFDKLPQATVILADEPRALFRDHGRTACTLAYISRRPPYSAVLLSRADKERGGTKR